MILIDDDTKRDGGTGGMVLELTMGGDGIDDVFYTVDLILGSSGATYSMLLDTGSSDLWVASSSCSSCNGAPKLYDPSHSSTSTSTGQSFSYNYLSGSVSGPIYWEQITLGNYTILHQALCAASSVSSESLGEGFSGILGLALPPLSQIQQIIPAGSGGGDEDGAAVISNLFGLPSGIGPSNQYFAISLSRPGFTDPTRSLNSFPARLGIGAQVDEIVHAVSSNNFDSAVQWVSLVTSAANGYTHWKGRLSDVTVWDNGTEKVVTLPMGNDGGNKPVAVLDTGGANWMASKAICDAVYGAWGISINGDGNYYVPCTLPLNVTVSFDSLPPIPIHPIDMSASVNNGGTTDPTNCLGTLQASNILGTPSAPADIALGISFLRNVYVIYSQSPPSSSGTNTAPGSTPDPKFGYVPLTNISLAMTEFHNIRVLNLGPDGGKAQPDVDANAGKESMGVIGKIMIGLGLFIGLCILLFGARWWVLDRRFKQRRDGNVSEEGVPMRERLDQLKRKGTRRFAQITEFGTPDGIEGDVATRSAYGHGNEASTQEHGRFITDTDAPPVPPLPSKDGMMRDVPSRPDNSRQASGPFAGFSLLTFIGARRLGFGGGYERTANPALSGERVDGLPTEEELRRQRFDEYRRRQTNEQRRNEVSVFSDTTWVGGDTLVPGGIARDGGLTPTPAETVVGSTTNLNAYGFPKVDEFGAARQGSDDGSEKGSTLHGSMEFNPKGGAYSLNRVGPGVGAGMGSLASSRNASRNSLPLNTKGSSGSLGRPGLGHAPHHSVPGLETDRPRTLREDSTKGLTSSPYPMTPAGDATPPRMTPQGSFNNPLPALPTPQGSTDRSFNPYDVPVSIPAPLLAPVHPVRERMALAMEPSLSPLTEVTSQEFPPSSRSDPSIRQSADVRRTSLLASVVPLAPVYNQNDSLRESLERQSSISGMSMESDVLVPLPITLMAMNSSNSSHLPTVDPRSSVVRVEGQPIRPFNVTLSDSPRASLDPPPLPPKEETPRITPMAMLPLASPPQPHQIRPVIIPATAQTSTPPAQPNRSRNPFDLLGVDDLDRDSRFPTFDISGRGDSRFPTFSPPSASSTPRARPVNIRSASASPSRPASVAVPEAAARPRPRITDPSLPRPLSEMQLGIPGAGDGSRGRSYSGGNAGMQIMDHPSPPVVSREQPAVEDPLRDFLPPHPHPRPQEQHTLPVTSSTRPAHPASRMSEPAVSSVGPRHRGPRPMNRPRSNSRDLPSHSSSTTGSAPSTRQGTTYDSPISFGSASASPPAAGSSGSGPRPTIHSRSGSGSGSNSLPPGAMAPHAPGTRGPIQIPTASPPRFTPATNPSPPANGSPPFIPQEHRRPPSPSTTTTEGPDAAYGGMAIE